MSKPKSRKRSRLTAKHADRYDLYQQSVQAPDFEAEFLDKQFRRAFGTTAILLREDFCGTAAVCCEWVKSHPDRKALGVDLDPEPIEWGKRHNLSQLTEEAQQRISFLEADVRSVQGPKADIISAQNFSYNIFKTRPELVEYFRAAYKNLAKPGIFALDMMGGSDCYAEDQSDKKKQDGFTYIWEESRFDPITHHCKFHIHFKFPDGTKMKRAFTYDWRLWTLPEVQEALQEVGFKDVGVWWEGTDPETGEGDSKFRRRASAEPDPSWICYVLAFK